MTNLAINADLSADTDWFTEPVSHRYFVLTRIVNGYILSGVKAVNGAASTLDNIVAEGNVTVETSEPIFIQHFNNQAAVDQMKPNSYAGGLTPEAFTAAKPHGWLGRQPVGPPVRRKAMSTVE